MVQILGSIHLPPSLQLAAERAPDMHMEAQQSLKLMETLVAAVAAEPSMALAALAELVRNHFPPTQLQAMATEVVIQPQEAMLPVPVVVAQEAQVVQFQQVVLAELAVQEQTHLQIGLTQSANLE